MGFWGGASSKEKKAQEAATATGEQRFGDIYGAGMAGAGTWGNRSQQQATMADERNAQMWRSLGPGGMFGVDAGGGGGGPAYRGDKSSIWGQLRDTGDLTPGDWDASRDVYRDFMDTGGWTPEGESDFRARGIAGTDMYDPSANAASRVQGGWGAGAGADDLARLKATSEMRRRGSFETEAELQGSKREGRKWGATSSEGLGARVQAGRITGQSKMDAERARANAAARGAYSNRQAALNQNWGRRMGLQGQSYGNIGQTGGDLPYLGVAAGAAGGAVGARQNAYGQQQQNQGWGSQLAGMAATMGGGIGSAASGLRKPRVT